MIVEPKREILLGPLLRFGLQRSWAARDHFLRLAALPLLAIVALLVPLQRAVLDVMAAAQTGSLPEDGIPVPEILLLSLACVAVLNVFAVNWLRQLTLGMGGAPGLGLSLRRRHLRFFLLMTVTSLAVCVVAAIVVSLVLTILGLAGSAAMVSMAQMAILLFVAAVLVRISPSWIGIALDAPMPLKVAWRRTAEQGLKLMLAMLAVEVPLLVVQQAIGLFFVLTGLLSVVPLTFTLMTAAVHLIGTAAQLAILVTAFPHFLRETV